MENSKQLKMCRKPKPVSFIEKLTRLFLVGQQQVRNNVDLQKKKKKNMTLKQRKSDVQKYRELNCDT